MINLSHGSGGKEMDELIKEIRARLKSPGEWKGADDDAAYLGDIVFTTDSFIATPLFFPGGDIGKIAVCGTINDLSVMGAKPIALSLGIVCEEGFLKEQLLKIVDSISKVCEREGVPVVTGDFKVTEKGKLDKIMINTAGVGKMVKPLANSGAKPGDAIIVSGPIAQHSAALLAARFGYSPIESDCGSVKDRIFSVIQDINSAKDPTRGGVAAALNEISEKSNVKIVIDEESVPINSDAKAVLDMLGVDIYSSASEGIFVCTTQNPEAIVRKLSGSAVIGKVESGSGVFLKTRVGVRKIHKPTGKLIPRIC